jgi:hypothetical protein
LTGIYGQAMQSCTRLQATGDKDRTTATEAGMIEAYEHIRDREAGGFGRSFAEKVVVVVTDGVPNLYVTYPHEIDSFINDYGRSNDTSDFYIGQYWKNAPLMQAAAMSQQHWDVFPVGLGLGTDYDFMDRMARLGGTAVSGAAHRGSGDPTKYESRLTEVFEKIIVTPEVRLVD